MKILNLMNKKKLTAQGSITVFMTFIFMIILSLILAIFENTRIISSTGYMKNASLSAEKTLFGDYNLELYKEYGLFGYGGYNGIDYDDMCQEFREIVKKNLCVKPENALLTYTDIYKIKSIAVKTEKSQGFKDGDNWDRQIKACLVNDTVDEIAVHMMKRKFIKNLMMQTVMKRENIRKNMLIRMKRGVMKSKEKQRLKIRIKMEINLRKTIKQKPKRIKPIKKEMTWKMRILETH